MQTGREDGQMSLFGQDGCAGKTYPAHSAATKAQTSKPSCLNCAGSRSQKPPLLLSLQPAGPTPENSLTWEAAASHGEPLTLNFTESPSVVVGSSLSAILQDNVLETYSLSPAACRGILRRAFVRGKPLPEPLLSALITQSSALTGGKTP